jgi:hypothetical protein
MRKSYAFRTFGSSNCVSITPAGKLPDPDSTHDFFYGVKKIYQTVAEFAEGFRLYRRKENKLSG